MKKRKIINSTRDNFIQGMLYLIEEKGSLTNINLRMISQHIGCAHTNAYNYFDGFDGLIFEAYDEALVIYRRNVVVDLNNSNTYLGLFTKFISNIINFALNHPGLYRFIGSDNFKIENLPRKTIDKAISLKELFYKIFYISINEANPNEKSDNFASIIMSYVDGELFNIINKRSFIGDDLELKIINNCTEIIKMFIEKKNPDFDIHSELITSNLGLI